DLEEHIRAIAEEVIEDELEALRAQRDELRDELAAHQEREEEADEERVRRIAKRRGERLAEDRDGERGRHRAKRAGREAVRQAGARARSRASHALHEVDVMSVVSTLGQVAMGALAREVVSRLMDRGHADEIPE